MKFHTQWDHPSPVTVTRPTPGVTVQQHMKTEVDINRIIAKAQQTGQIPPGRIGGTFAEYPREIELMDAYDLVADAEESFAALPAQVRARFQNDPVLLCQFLGDEKNRAEAVSLGLIQPPERQPESVEKNTKKDANGTSSEAE